MEHGVCSQHFRGTTSDVWSVMAVGKDTDRRFRSRSSMEYTQVSQACPVKPDLGVLGLSLESSPGAGVSQGPRAGRLWFTGFSTVLRSRVEAMASSGSHAVIWDKWSPSRRMGLLRVSVSWKDLF